MDTAERDLPASGGSVESTTPAVSESGETPPAVCFNCGDWKETAFGRCLECGVAPRAEKDLAASLVLSDRYSSRRDLLRQQALLNSGRAITLNQRKLANAVGAIRDPRFRESMGMALFLDPPPAHPLSSPRMLWLILAVAVCFFGAIALSGSG